MTYEVLEFTHVDTSVHSLASAELDVEAQNDAVIHVSM